MRRSAGKSLSSFSRAFSRHAAGERVGRAGEGFVCGWKRGGSREAPGRPEAVSKPEEAELPRGADDAEMGWTGHSGDPRDRRWAIRFGLHPFAQLSGTLGPPTPQGDGGEGAPSARAPSCPRHAGAGGSAPLGTTRFLGTQHYPGGLWVLEGARPGGCPQPGEILMETQPRPHKGSLQTGLSPGWVRRFGAAPVQRLSGAGLVARV